MVVTYGEIMGRVEPEGPRRFAQAVPGTVHLAFAGAEANVAAAVALCGGRSRFVTAIPDHFVADGVVTSLRAIGVDTRFILRRREGRLGLFFVESGVNQRPSVVVYDRDQATVALTPASEYPWGDIFGDGDWFHVTGITPAISRVAAEVTLEAVTLARNAGLTVSADLNFRSKLWRWDPSLASSIADAIAVYLKETPARFIPLPLTVEEGPR